MSALPYGEHQHFGFSVTVEHPTLIEKFGLAFIGYNQVAVTVRLHQRWQHFREIDIMTACGKLSKKLGVAIRTNCGFTTRQCDVFSFCVPSELLKDGGVTRLADGIWQSLNAVDTGWSQ